ncbi:DMT(drug/metabolite transporter) superfamily permease [Actinoalloteichus hymeniacidonis]|uniref:DMT(Drug/metabolite transporter) superfamily permease n=1 Tax=Actinoalloteichus hymeniacidonis TaxID=340345 RepID=A0AAC9HLZ8_9PSEU|nr:DMT(drug/metabolite transporter) superfamily permease [Actinoalloteichus hymeniacidonis]
MTIPEPATIKSAAPAIAFGLLGIALVGASVPVTGLLDDYPLFAAQSVRYLIGAAGLFGWLVLRGQRLPKLVPRDLLALGAVATLGMVGFSICVLLAQRHADPGFVTAMVGSAPLVLGILAPLLAGRRPGRWVIGGATLVLVGVVVLSGGGSWQGPGLLLACLAMFGEVSFTLFAVGPIRRLGAIGASAYACLIAAIGAGVVSAVAEGPPAWRLPDATETVALIVLGLLVTSVAFVWWFHCVSRIGADRAAVLIGAMPVAGLVASVCLSAQQLTSAALLGAALVAAGCAVGLRRVGPSRPAHRPRA